MCEAPAGAGCSGDFGKGPRSLSGGEMPKRGGVLSGLSCQSPKEWVVCTWVDSNTIDDRNPASPVYIDMYYTTRNPILLAEIKVMQDFYHQH